MLPFESITHQIQKGSNNTGDQSRQAASNSNQREDAPPSYSCATTHRLPTNFIFAGPQAYGDSDDSQVDMAAPITLKIDMSTRIMGHGNLIAVPNVDPQTTSTRVAAGMLAALRQMSALSAFETEDGRSRPVEISILSGINVTGSNNVFGVAKPKARETVHNNGGRDNEPNAQQAARKRKAESEPPESRPSKI
ncbi:hypothetical protein L228DRAFT_279556 [Xylona heveae TC161]|uniref:Uncharacterized protein n=1 Tax=Xylona heveae (strain CBS 132557 / TC161) TaxID=1328760 RepID=A0A165JK99_XYLHT|nr:hypothetical protein L228DRAFT_279556 [Xylona heveae TC161]KZF26340.1 hypothetical protein L228DRAFT_279556 [Xylona heveae TC161]